MNVVFAKLILRSSPSFCIFWKYFGIVRGILYESHTGTSVKGFFGIFRSFYNRSRWRAVPQRVRFSTLGAAAGQLLEKTPKCTNSFRSAQNALLPCVPFRASIFSINSPAVVVQKGDSRRWGLLWLLLCFSLCVVSSYSCCWGLITQPSEAIKNMAVNRTTYPRTSH